jgi:nucleoside 2-deoxyribosyltransferase
MKIDRYSQYRTELANGKRKIYLGIRLYDYIEKIKASMFETAVISGVKEAFNEMGVDLKYFPTFMPFRDTRENEIISQNKAKIIYQQDIKRLNKELFATIGYLNDPSKDDGICMELGYNFALSMPSLIAITDFIWYSSRAIPELEFLIDPVLLRIIGKTIHKYELPPSENAYITQNLEDMEKIKFDFYRRLKIAFQDVLNLVQFHTRRLVLNPEEYVSTPIEYEENEKSIYIDFGGGKHEWERKMMNYLSKTLKKMNYTVFESKRHKESNQRNIYDKFGEKAPIELGEIDIQNAMGSNMIIVCGDGAEVDGGTAAIQGIAKAMNKPIILYYSGNLEIHGEGKHRMIRNLMLEHSADILVTEIKAIPKFVEKLS